ncbi:hypothetical protein PHYSODRAFT_353828 [Phytophthora sojae]|uniref:Uncharacterized protein n=1 Tax=Phytophthora sojae (strain P6497) TaxID=1094619 RepID=G4YRI0_PHYSP|nr:hypothetical protein PHYSODRAFT_353828 [Phytophthora sojae]EGZ23445.1 hypothetical protein PHYSODRAFT_353828 [Phytophthora sojae]|eukprot:XP_009518733.1 hypothetical protein PHYSODRAFT_353828 [Phytophthora sojae]
MLEQILQLEASETIMQTSRNLFILLLMSAPSAVAPPGPEPSPRPSFFSCISSSRGPDTSPSDVAAAATPHVTKSLLAARSQHSTHPASRTASPTSVVPHDVGADLLLLLATRGPRPRPRQGSSPRRRRPSVRCPPAAAGGLPPP